MLFISVAVYGVDTFVAINLLAFNNWSSQIDPAVDLTIAKWVFVVCIIASFINLGFEHFRAWRIMKRGNVAECYLDHLAARLESIRMGKGQGWRRFLVFAALTKSKKGAEYVALFTYFNLQCKYLGLEFLACPVANRSAAWIRVLVCSGPRQVINALTLYSVYDADLASKDATSIDRTFMGMFENIDKLAKDDYQQVIILSAMAFTLIIWIFSALFLILAVLFYVFFLWHWIPSADGGLSGYCERKVNDSLVKIVTKRVNKALEREQKSRMKAEYKAGRPGEKPMLARQATLPTIPDLGPGVDGGDKLPEMPTMQRTNTYATLPPYASRPGTPGSIELSAMDQKRPVPSRSGTSSSKQYSTRAGLMANASDMGVSSPLSPAPSMPSVDYNQYGASGPHSPAGFSRMGTQSSNPSLRHQQSTTSSFGGRYTETPANYSEMPYPAPARSPTVRPDGYSNNLPPIPRGNAGTPFSAAEGRASPAPSSVYSTQTGPGLPRHPGQNQSSLNGGGFQAYQPTRSATGPAPYRQQQQQPPRNNTTGDYYRRQPSQGSAFEYDYDVESQRRY